MTETVERALQNLLLPEYSAVKDLLGDVLTKRSKQREANCFIFSLLALNETHELGKLDKDSAAYILELGLQEAQRKCKTEVMGVVTRPPREFNARFADFWAEMAAIRVLSDDGFHRFRPTEKNEPDGATNDYLAYREQARAYVEVKNLHANETVFGVFIRELGRAYEHQPSEYVFHLGIEYAYDCLPTGEQERIIRDFIRAIGGRKPPFRETLNLIDDIATVDVAEGFGNAHLSRNVGGDSPEAVNYEWLLKKIRTKAEEARGQIPEGDHIKVLVINVDTTNAMLDLGFVQAAKQEILIVFGDNVQPYVLHFRYLVPTPGH